MSSKNSFNIHTNGMGLLGWLQLVFIVLRVLEVIQWSWWKVFIPLYISAGLFVVILIIYVIALIISDRH